MASAIMKKAIQKIFTATMVATAVVGVGFGLYGFEFWWQLAIGAVVSAVMTMFSANNAAVKKWHFHLSTVIPSLLLLAAGLSLTLLNIPVPLPEVLTSIPAVAGVMLLLGVGLAAANRLWQQLFKYNPHKEKATHKPSSTFPDVGYSPLPQEPPKLKTAPKGKTFYDIYLNAVNKNIGEIENVFLAEVPETMLSFRDTFDSARNVLNGSRKSAEDFLRGRLGFAALVRPIDRYQDVVDLRIDSIDSELTQPQIEIVEEYSNSAIKILTTYISDRKKVLLELEPETQKYIEQILDSEERECRGVLFDDDWLKIIRVEVHNDPDHTYLQKVSPHHIKSYIIPILCKNKDITGIWANKNMITGSEGLEELATAFLSNELSENFRSLALNNSMVLQGAQNVYSDTGIKALSDALLTNNTLITLELRGNNLGDTEVSILCQGVERNEGLAYLSLSANNIGAKGACDLLAALHLRQRLFNISILSNDLGVQGWGVIALLLMLNPNIIFLEEELEAHLQEAPVELQPLLKLITSKDFPHDIEGRKKELEKFGRSKNIETNEDGICYDLEIIKNNFEEANDSEVLELLLSTYECFAKSCDLPIVKKTEAVPSLQQLAADAILGVAYKFIRGELPQLPRNFVLPLWKEIGMPIVESVISNTSWIFTNGMKALFKGQLLIRGIPQALTEFHIREILKAKLALSGAENEVDILGVQLCEEKRFYRENHQYYKSALVYFEAKSNPNDTQPVENAVKSIVQSPNENGRSSLPYTNTSSLSVYDVAKMNIPSKH